MFKKGIIVSACNRNFTGNQLVGSGGGSISICEHQPLGAIQQLLFESITLVTVPGGIEPPHM